MGSPIRCLDELSVSLLSFSLLSADLLSDVYMDHINRKMAIDMLVSRAHCPPPAQTREKGKFADLTLDGCC